MMKKTVTIVRIGITLSLLFFSMNSVEAAWNPPTCNPDIVGPTDPTCNVSAPLNASAAAQTKLGDLTIQTTIQADDLNISGDIGGNGTAAIKTFAGNALSILQEGTGKGIVLQQSNSNTALEIIQGDGIAVDITSSSTGSGVNITNTAATGLTVNGGVGGPAIDVNGASSGIEIEVAEIGVYAASTNTNAAFFSGENSATTLVANNGSGGTAALFEAGADITTYAPPGSLQALGEDGLHIAALGYGVTAFAEGSSISTSAAVLASSRNGYGIFAESESVDGLYANTNDPTTSYGGYLCNQYTNCAALGGPIHSAIFNGSIRGDADSSLYPAATFTNVDPSGWGVEIVADTRGLKITAEGGNAIEAASAPYGYVLEGGDGIITGGLFEGGSFISNEPSGEGLHPNIPNIRPGVTTVEKSGTIRGLEFDGTDVWIVSTDPDYVYRVNAQNGQIAFTYDLDSITGQDPAFRPYTPVQAHNIRGDAMYIFGNNGAYWKIKKTESPASLSTSKATGATGDIYGAAYSGNYFWLASTTGLWAYLATETTPATQYINNGSRFYEVILANGMVWASSFDTDEVYVINDAAPAADPIIISVPNKPRGMTYDGQYVWVVGVDGTLTRIHAKTYQTETFDISALGDGGTARHITFDGSRIWITYNSTGKVGWFDISTKTMGSNYSIPGANYMIFDGTNMWVGGENSGNPAWTPIPTGTGFGTGTATVQAGIILSGEDGNFHCLYIDSGGNLQKSTSMSKCGF